MCLYNKKGMNTWNDIYDFSEKVLSYILRKKEEEYIQPDQDSPVEKMADKLGNSETLAERLQQQYRYDPIRAYRKLKNYRRRRRIRRYSVAAGILLVLGLGWGWFHQNSPGDPLLLTQTIQPGGKKAVLKSYPYRFQWYAFTGRERGENGKYRNLPSVVYSPGRRIYNDTGRRNASVAEFRIRTSFSVAIRW